MENGSGSGRMGEALGACRHGRGARAARLPQTLLREAGRKDRAVESMLFRSVFSMLPGPREARAAGTEVGPRDSARAGCDGGGITEGRGGATGLWGQETGGSRDRKEPSTLRRSRFNLRAVGDIGQVYAELE